MTQLPTVRSAKPGLLAPGPAEENNSAAAEPELRARLREATETLDAIRGGGIDSLVLGPPGQQQVYTLATADRSYRLIVEAMSEGAAIVSPRGVILDANPRLDAMTGRPATELAGAPALELVSEADRPTFARLLDVGAGDSARGEVGLIGPDHTVPVMLAVSGFDLDGMLLRCLVMTDLSAHHATAEQIRATAVYNRNLIDASLDPLIIVDVDGEITDVNAAAEQATGYGRPELIGTQSSDYFAEPDLVRSGHEQVLLEGNVRDYAVGLRHRDGHVTPVLFNASVYRDSSGQVLGVVAAGRDLTRIKRAEAGLRDSEARLRAIIDYAQVGINELTPDGEFVRVNPYFCKLIGYTADELRSLSLKDIVHPDDLRADLANIERLVSGELQSYSMEKRLLCKGGGIVWVETSRALVRDADGSPKLFVAVLRDITARRHAEAEVLTLSAEREARVHELERANKNLEAFTYSVSHDLRAPLRALSGFSEALLEEYGDGLDETGHEYAKRIQAASERMAALIDDLLHLSRVSRAGMNLRPVDLSAEVTAIAGELKAGEPDRVVSFSIQGSVWVTADHTLIRSVVQNLIDNAWKFTARRDDAVIEFGTTTADDARIWCYVRDNGAGFDPEYKDKLFQPFQRLHTDREFPGNGIGLASVQRIIERHGGRVWAEGAIGNGATFYFTLAGASSGAHEPQ